MSCEECNAILPERKSRYCKECLKRVCTRCFKVGLLCTTHFNSLPEHARNALAKDTRAETMYTITCFIGIVLSCTALVTLVILVKTDGNELFIPSMWGLIIGLGMFIGAYSQGNRRMVNRYTFLKGLGIHVQFKPQRETSYTCDVCGSASPGLAKSPFKCRVCSKTLCVNCFTIPGLCPSHDKAISPAIREWLMKHDVLKGRIKFLLVAWPLFTFAYALIIVQAGNLEGLALFQVLIFSFLIIFPLPLTLLERREKQIIRDANQS